MVAATILRFQPEKGRKSRRYAVAIALDPQFHVQYPHTAADSTKFLSILLTSRCSRCPGYNCSRTCVTALQRRHLRLQLFQVLLQAAHVRFQVADVLQLALPGALRRLPVCDDAAVHPGAATARACVRTLAISGEMPRCGQM